MLMRNFYAYLGYLEGFNEFGGGLTPDIPYNFLANPDIP